MMEFLVFALVALPLCSSLLPGFPNSRQEGVELRMRKDFSLTPDVLKEECNVDFKTAWRKISAALNEYDRIHSFTVIDILDDAEDNDDKSNGHMLDKCLKNKALRKAAMDVIEAALPCAKKESLDKHFESAKARIC